jgi:hypothetical protein
MRPPAEVICLNFRMGQMGSGILQMQKMAFFWILIGNLGEFLLQTLHNHVHKKDRSKVSPGGNMTISTIPTGETHPKHDLLCTDKLRGSSRASSVSPYPHFESWIFKVDSNFITRDDSSEVDDLKLGEFSEKFP